jgi:hypothetical protein
MKNRMLGMVVALATALCCPLIGYSDTKSGEAKLQELKARDVSAKALKVSLGDKVKADCTYYIMPDFLGKRAVSVQARIKNSAGKPMYFGYYVAFFDKDKNLIATSFASKKLDPGEKIIIGNAIPLPSEQLKRIAFYQVTLLEDEKEFGK